MENIDLLSAEELDLRVEITSNQIKYLEKLVDQKKQAKVLIKMFQK